MSGFFLALSAVGAGAYLATRDRRPSQGVGLNGLSELASNPGVFGIGAGIANGLIAAARDKPMSITANIVTAAVIGISEGVLSEDKEAAFETAFMSTLGASAGMAAFTRWNPEERAFFESEGTPLPA